MSDTTKRGWVLAVCSATAVAALALVPHSSQAQGTPTDMISSVTDNYSFEMMLPGMPSGEVSNLRNAADWCLDAAKNCEMRAAEMKKQIDAQREAKKAEIKALEARGKAAGKTKDEVLKKQLEASVKEQKVQLEILETIKKLSENETAMASQYESTGKALESLAASYQSLTEARETALKVHEKAVEAAKQAGLTAPAPSIDFESNGKTLQIFKEAGGKMKSLGEKMENLASAREELLKNWQKWSEAKAKR